MAAQPRQAVKVKLPKRRCYALLTARSRLCSIVDGDGGYTTYKNARGQVLTQLQTIGTATQLSVNTVRK